MVVWVMMGIALWHFAVFVPDRFWGGIVGAFLAAIFGAVVFGFVISGFTVPGQNDTTIAAALEAIPGAVLGLAASWFYGSMTEGEHRPGPAIVESMDSTVVVPPSWTLAVRAGGILELVKEREEAP